MAVLSALLLALWALPALAAGTHSVQGRSPFAAAVSGTAVKAVAAPAGGPVAPADWTASFVAVWNMDDAAGTRVNASGTTCGASCNLTQAGTVTRNTTFPVEGSAFAAGMDETTNTLSCTGVGCPQLDFGTGQHVVWGGWVRTANTTATRLFLNNINAGNGYAAFHRNTNALLCQAGATGTPFSQSSTATSFPISTWTHAVCKFDNTANEIVPFIDGAVDGCTPGSTCSGLTDIGASGTAFTLAGAGDPATSDGEMDESFVFNGILTAAQICRICSCNVNGSACSCNSSSPTQYVSSGRNAGSNPGCGSCTLPACNAVAP